MSKEEFLKIQTCVLKVNIHCEGCKNKVKKILQRIEGVYTIKIDSESGKVTVSGNVDSATLIKKLIKKGKHAELWGGQKANNNQNHQLNNQLKNLQIENGKRGNGNKGQGEKGSNNNNNQMQMKGGNPVMPSPQQLQQLQQMKVLQDMKMPPQFKDLKFPMNMGGGGGGGGGGNPKTVKFDLPDEDDFTDDEFDDDDEYDDDEEDDDFDDEMDLMPPTKMKPMMDNGGGGAQMPNIMHLMNGKKGGIMPQMNMGGGNKGGNVNQIQGGGSPKKSGKNGGGHPQDGKNFGSNGGQNKNSGGGHGGAGGGPNFNGNGGNKGGGMNNGLPSMPNMMAMKASVPNMGPMPTGQMGHHMGQMSNLPMGQIPAVQGLPAPGMSSVRTNGAYFQAAGPEILAGNPYHQQQMAAMMMNQQHANGNERFQPMMYAPQPPAVNYLPPPYPYYPYPPPSDNYGSMFSDENPSACKVM